MLDLPSPCVVVVGSFVNPKSIVKQILKCDTLPEAFCLGENVEGFPWEIDTKYYKACVNICPVNNEDVLPEKLFNSAEGLILYFDSQNVDSFDNVKKWNDQMKETPEVLLLVCDKFYDNSSEVSRSSALAWCLQHGYELVELQEPEEAGSGDYDIIPDRKGADRICEALEAHTWSNLDMKAHSNTNPPGAHSPDLNLEADTEDFMELFSQLQSMRESIQSLPPRDRHACAEQVVATFWRAVGGDEEEVQGILDLE